MILVYPEPLGRAIGEEAFEQLASVINFRVCGGKFRHFLHKKIRFRHYVPSIVMNAISLCYQSP